MSKPTLTARFALGARPAALAAGLLLSSCLGPVHFHGTYAEQSVSGMDILDGCVIERESYREFSYGFWGETFEGHRATYVARSTADRPIRVRVQLDLAGCEPYTELEHDFEQLVAPGASAPVASILVSPAVDSVQFRVKACWVERCE